MVYNYGLCVGSFIVLYLVNNGTNSPTHHKIFSAISIASQFCKPMLVMIRYNLSSFNQVKPGYSMINQGLGKKAHNGHTFMAL